ncbi:WD40-repeat-containing domain protein [Phascolomyces articulosus]|uniref:WD40-repeat-containing domain protein n=1 Tax=Phascolomyces articulosus TaxID=60185 RepID=A0AAD5PK66_9FUNG|nr:WD40-repeat-containing domain protein [Phascolomyces articulosus]
MSLTYSKKYTLAPLPQTNRGEGIKLGADPKGKNFLYTNGKSVFIRDIENPTLATEYLGHKAQTTVARYSPSGFYIASGDAQGNLRVWDTVNEEHISKTEVQAVSGKITDVAWDHESKRLIAVGDGNQRFGYALSLETNSAVGEISGHSKVINSVSVRQKRPFRAVTASDDMTVAFFTGVPYKYVKSIRDHTRFIYDVQFSPNGDHFVSVGADGKIFLYDGQSGDKIDELTSDEAHSGSIFSVNWSPDSTQILTSSADCTAKIWDISAKSVVNTFEINSASDAVSNQQVGNLWQGDWLLSTSLSGEINYLDKNSGKVSRSIDGHGKAITALAVSSDDTLFTGSYDGRVCSWSFGADGDHTAAKNFSGENHTNQVVGLEVQGDKLLSAGMDDTLRVGELDNKSFGAKLVSTGALPKSLAATNEKTVVATFENVQVYDADSKKICQQENLGYTPTVGAIDPSGKTVFVGGEVWTLSLLEIQLIYKYQNSHTLCINIQDNKVHVYELEGDSLKHIKDIGNHIGYISALAPHPTLNLIAVGDSVGKIFLYDIETGKATVQNWVFHSGRITGLSWSKCGVFLVSGGIDTNVFVWNREKQFKKLAISNAHVDAVNDVGFLNSSLSDENHIAVVSVGQDAAVHIYDASKPQ